VDERKSYYQTSPAGLRPSEFTPSPKNEERLIVMGRFFFCSAQRRVAETSYRTSFLLNAQTRLEPKDINELPQ
jgi:hypothetical protein